MSILSEFTTEEIESSIEENPSLRGYLQGYLAEIALKKQLLLLPGVISVEKIPDQSKDKGDFKVIYKGSPVVIECKSILTDSIKFDTLNDTWYGRVPLRAAKARNINVEGLGIVNTAHFFKNQFDILAISCYAIDGKWEFLFVETEYLSIKSPSMPGLLKSNLVVNPLTTPCVTSDITSVLESVISKKASLIS